MARNGVEIGEPALILALASGKSITETAALAGLSERTVSRRMADPRIRVQVARTRLQMLNRGLGVMMTQFPFAAATLGKLMRSQNEAIQLSAAKSVIGETTRLVEMVDLSERLTELEERVSSQDRRGRNGKG